MGLSVSIILPTHDRPTELGAAIDSIMAQSRGPDELIIIDDGISPARPDIDRWAKQTGVRFIYEKRSRPSLPASRNRGLGIATGDIIVFCEDDVTWPVDYLEKLIELYEADTEGSVAAIGAVVVEPDDNKLTRRVFDCLADALGRGKWRPRLNPARYASLPEILRGKLTPASRLSGGAMSLRSNSLGQFRFDESLDGYALGEDREFCYRFGQQRSIYLGPQLKVAHSAAGRGSAGMFARGRMFAANNLHIASKSLGGGAGTYLLAYYELAGAVGLGLFWSLITLKSGPARFAAGIVTQLLSQGCNVVKEILCGF